MKKSCSMCLWALPINMDKEYESVLEMIRDDDYLICINPLNNHARTINDGSNRLINMDTGLSLPHIGFQVDDDSYCEAFAISEQMQKDIKVGCYDRV